MMSKSKMHDSNPDHRLQKLDPGYSLVILVYTLVTVFTPNLKAFDSNGPKFLALAVANLLVFGYFLLRKDFRSDRSGFVAWFLHPMGIAYSVFLIFCAVLLSRRSIRRNG